MQAWRDLQWRSREVGTPTPGRVCAFRDIRCELLESPSPPLTLQGSRHVEEFLHRDAEVDLQFAPTIGVNTSCTGQNMDQKDSNVNPCLSLPGCDLGKSVKFCRPQLPYL